MVDGEGGSSIGVFQPLVGGRWSLRSEVGGGLFLGEGRWRLVSGKCHCGRWRVGGQDAPGHKHFSRSPPVLRLGCK